jgi:hypothetical protein
MIIFVPKKHPLQDTLADLITSVHNKQNKMLSDSLNEKFVQLYCPKHRRFECVIEVDLSSKGESIEIASYCCEEFKTTIESLLSQEKDPPEG